MNIITDTTVSALPTASGLARSSHWIGHKGAQTLYYAEQQASRIGLPLNWSITINFTVLGVAPSDAVAAFQVLRSQRFAPWVRRPPKQVSVRAAAPTYTYGFENYRDGHAFGEDDDEHNIHVHWTVHVPRTRWRSFEGALHGWITEIVGGKDWPTAGLRMAPITRQGGAPRYPNKGARSETAAHFGVPKEKAAYQGIIFGKRVGTSRNIGPTARMSLDRKLGIDRKRNRRLWQDEKKRRRDAGKPDENLSDSH